MGAADVHQRLAEEGHRLVLVEVTSGPTGPGAALTARWETLPAVVVAVGAGGDPPPWADIALEDADRSQVDRIRASVTDHPLASVALALLLRSSGSLGTGAGLVAESAVYSMLQAGPEFAAWRQGRPVRVHDPSTVDVERQGGTLRIVLNRPGTHNALDSAMRDGLVEALLLAAFDPSIAGIGLSGAGPSFCSGGDLDEFGQRPDPASAHLIRLTQSPARLMAELSDRITVNVHGSTMGSGIELAAFAHRVVAHHATRIALPEIGLGLVPGSGGAVSLPRRIGRHRTALLALAGLEIDANTALSWGLVDAVVD